MVGGEMPKVLKKISSGKFHNVLLELQEKENLCFNQDSLDGNYDVTLVQN
jgi:hypothetical protein